MSGSVTVHHFQHRAGPAPVERFDWNGYKFSPASGTVDGGDQESVTVDVGLHLLTSGTVTVTASGAVNSPQQVTISCTL